MWRAPALSLLLLLASCSAPQSHDVAVAAGQYGVAFDAARHTLDKYHFALERVDAREGVITTRPKGSAGLAAPWDPDQTTLAQKWEDFVNDQQRTVRITFEPVQPQGAPGEGAGPPADLREHAGPMTAHFDVVVERIHHTGWRLEPTALRLSTQARDPALEKRGLWPTYDVAFSQDTLLAARLAEAMRRGLAGAPVRTAPAPHP